MHGIEQIREEFVPEGVFEDSGVSGVPAGESAGEAAAPNQ